MKCPNCNAIIPDTDDICPACFSSIIPAPVPPPRESAPAAPSCPPPGQQAPPREAPPAPSRPGRPLSRLLLPAGIGALVITIIIIAVIALTRHRAPVPPVAAVPAPAKAAPAAPQEETKPAPTPSPVQEKKVVKKAPSSRTKKPVGKEAQPQAAPKQAWTYKPQAQPAPQPQQKQATQKGGIAGFLDRTLGPEKDVTPPPPVSDARGTGM